VTSTLADGRKVINNLYTLPSLTIAGVTVHNVHCVVVQSGGGYLLGQAVLKKFKSWSIDNERHVLVLHQIAEG
jgi:predicted aspartyl protease